MAERIAQGRIPELDGLRGIAILLVLSAHYFAVPGAGRVSWLDGYWFRLGWTGVDLFFVLSGFLIGGILLGVRDSPRYFKTFYARRFFRIVPLYYAWIAAYVLLATFARRILLTHVGTMEGIGIPILAQVLFLQNFHDFLGSTVSFWWFTATWSLAVEEQFYLLAPVLVRYLSRRALACLLIIVAAGAPFLRLFVRDRFSSGAWFAYRLMPCRADSLAIGMLLALLWGEPKIRGWLIRHALLLYGFFGILLAGVAYLWRWYSDPLQPLTQTIGYTWLALFFATLILLALARPSAPVAFLARLGILREFGGVSYCMYIVHPALFLLCHRILLHRLPVVTDERAAAVTFLSALLTYIIAKLSWKFFEQPLLRRGHAYNY